MEYDYILSLIREVLESKDRIIESKDRIIAQKDETIRFLKNRPPVTSSKSIYKKGYVYFIRSDNGMVKIGKTQDCKQRFASITRCQPFTVEPIFIIETKDMDLLERAFHIAFHEKRGKGEWFHIDEQDIEMIRSSFSNHFHNYV